MKPSINFKSCVSFMHRVVLPERVAKPFYDTGHKRIKVVTTYLGASLTIYAALYFRQNLYFISFGKRYQKELGLPNGENFHLQVFADDSKYGAAMPEELEEVLDSDYDALIKFEALTDGKKRSLLFYISRFKNVQTKIDKALIISENLKMGITDTKMLVKA